MQAWIDGLYRYAAQAGAGGLFALSAVDSAGAVTGGAPDLLLALLVSLCPRPLEALALAAAATAGSAVGCFGLYTLGRRGAGAGLRRVRMAAVVHARTAIERRGAWVLLLVMIAPPPVPLKLFVLGAGAAAMRPSSFLAATLAGRTLRYAAVAAVALRYGPRALDRLRLDAGSALGVAAAVALSLLALNWIRRRRRAPAS